MMTTKNDEAEFYAYIHSYGNERRAIVDELKRLGFDAGDWNTGANVMCVGVNMAAGDYYLISQPDGIKWMIGHYSADLNEDWIEAEDGILNATQPVAVAAEVAAIIRDKDSEEGECARDRMKSVLKR